MSDVVFSQEAQGDIDDIFAWIAGRANVAVAKAYTDRIRDYCLGLQTFPVRGVRRDEIFPGLRTLGFRRRATIAFKIDGERIIVLRILHAGRNFENAFPPPPV